MREYYVCTSCRSPLGAYIIIRKSSQVRKSLHLKCLYCPTCRKEQQHIKVGPPLTFEVINNDYRKFRYLVNKARRLKR